MKYIKLLWFDIRNGMVRKLALFIAPALIAIVAYIDLANRSRSLNAGHYLGTTLHPSFADYIIYIYGGMQKYVPNTSDPFVFPVRWILVFLAISFIVSNYPYSDLQSFGQQILIRTRGRTLWWLSKCGWNILSSLVYHCVLYLVVLVGCIATDAKIPGDINLNLLHAVFTMDRAYLVPGTSLPFSILFLPILISLGINLLQMTLSLFVKPIFSFLVLSLLMISSAYFLSPYWIGNYAMPVRYNMVTLHGINMTYGVVIAIALILASVLAGVIRFRYYDILNRD